MKLAELVTGGRKTYGNVVMGGLRRDMTGHEIKESLRILHIIETQVEEVWDAVMDDQRQMKRWKGVEFLINKSHATFRPSVRTSEVAALNATPVTTTRTTFSNKSNSMLRLSKAATYLPERWCVIWNSKAPFPSFANASS